MCSNSGSPIQHHSFQHSTIFSPVELNVYSYLGSLLSELPHTHTKRKCFSNNYFFALHCTPPSRPHSHFQFRTFFTSRIGFEPVPKVAKGTKLWQDEEEKSKVEEAVEAMKEKKEKLKEKAFELNSSVEEVEPIVTVSPPPKKTIWQRVKHEAIHYYNGFKLLYFEIKIAGRLLWQVMNGKMLTRRERRQVRII